MYNLLQELENANLLTKCVKGGVIPMNLTAQKKIYEYYLQEKAKYQNSQAITNTADEFHISEKYVYKIVYKMKG